MYSGSNITPNTSTPIRQSGPQKPFEPELDDDQSEPEDAQPVPEKHHATKEEPSVASEPTVVPTQNVSGDETVDGNDDDSLDEVPETSQSGLDKVAKLQSQLFIQ